MKIIHRRTDELLAEGKHGWAITPFEGNYYISAKALETVKRHCEACVAMFRCGDDVVVCCQFEKDAKRVREALGKRLARYRLCLNERKTRLVPFSRRARRRGERQRVFDFLGFTFFWGRTRRGAWIPKVKTSGARLRIKLKRVATWARAVRNRRRLPWIWAMFCAKLRGHIQYFGVSFNAAAVHTFIRRATRILFRHLNRRSQRKSFSWERFTLFMQTHPFPRVRICHPLFVSRVSCRRVTDFVSSLLP